MEELANLWDLLEMKLDGVEDILDELEDKGEDVSSLRDVMATMWTAVDEII